MRRADRLGLLLLAPWTLLSGTAANGAVIYESQSGPTTPYSAAVSIFSGAYSGVGNPQWLGAEFHVTHTVRVSDIGANFAYFEGTIFGAIISLPGPDALPTGTVCPASSSGPTCTSGPITKPFAAGQVRAETTIDGGDPTYALNVTLQPGDYALLFGSGAFGTAGFSGIYESNVVDPNAVFLAYGNQNLWPGGPRWFRGDFTGTRFVVDGAPAAPEPAVWATLCLGFGLLGATLRVRRRRNGARPPPGPASA